jgi:hypothetical protein
LCPDTFDGIETTCKMQVKTEPRAKRLDFIRARICQLAEGFWMSIITMTSVVAPVFWTKNQAFLDGGRH